MITSYNFLFSVLYYSDDWIYARILMLQLLHYSFPAIVKQREKAIKAAEKQAAIEAQTVRGCDSMAECGEACSLHIFLKGLQKLLYSEKKNTI